MIAQIDSNIAQPGTIVPAISVMPASPKLPSNAPPPKQRRNIQFVCDHYITEVHGGVVDYARKAGWSLYDGSCYVPSLKVDEMWDGILATVILPELAAELRAQSCPVVRLTCASELLPFPAVEQDSVGIGAMGAAHLLTLGSPTFAFYRVCSTDEIVRIWTGFSRTLAAAGKTAHLLDSSRVIDGVKNRLLPRADRWELLREQLSVLPRPVAVMVEDDRFAHDLFVVAEMLGWRIPEDLAVLGTDDRPLVHGTLPVPLSSVDSNLRGVGWAGAAMLDRILDGQPAPADPILIAPRQVTARQSTATFTCANAGVNAAVKYLRAHFAEPIKVPKLARLAGCSTRSLQAAFKQYVGRTFTEELTHLRCAHAAHLLRDTTLKLESVAFESGLKQASYLCHVFRSVTGETPAEYRQKQRALREG
jgi:LacI family transcriptional regulator